ncbi:MAG: alpha/beta fold hydrolase [Sphingorhabdus sp.]
MNTNGDRRKGLTYTRCKRGYLDGPFGQIHYYELGSGPCLILAHQSPLNGRQFEKGMSLLAAKGLRVIAIDTPGYGNSDGPDEAPTIQDYASIYPWVMKGLRETKAHFLGHHTGASILCAFAVAYPEYVSSLILNGPVIATKEELKEFEGIHFGPPKISRDGSHLIEAWRVREHFTPGWTDEVVMHRRLVDQLWAGDKEWFGHYAAFEYDMISDFIKLAVPTMIFTNTGDDAYKMALRAHKLRPEMTYCELEGGTHDIVDEQPEAWANAVTGYIKDLT